jgi:hypothetical protein
VDISSSSSQSFSDFTNRDNHSPRHLAEGVQTSKPFAVPTPPTPPPFALLSFDSNRRSTPPPPNAPSTALFHLESDLLSPFSLPLHRRKFGPRTPRTVIDSCLENPLPATAEQKFPMYMTDRGARSGGFFWCYLGGPKVFCPALRWWGFGRFTLLLFYLRCVL